MRIAVIYQSRGGNTKAVAEAVAKAANVTAEPFGKPFDGVIDLLFVGGKSPVTLTDKQTAAAEFVARVVAEC